MNYLAHAYLSFNHPAILVGNMISDFVKGSSKNSYIHQIQQGISLHRSIDHFTDNHSSTKKAKEFFKPLVGLYAGAFVDVLYDHFLATDETQFSSSESLQSFATNVYHVLQQHQTHLPEKFIALLPFMMQQNWLYNYQFTWGIEKSFQGVVRRAKYLSSSKEAYKVFEENYTSLLQYYQVFFTDVKNFAWQQFQSF